MHLVRYAAGLLRWHAHDAYEVLAKALELDTPLVELTGGEPLLQPGAIPLMRELCDAGKEVLVETSGEADVSRCRYPGSQDHGSEGAGLGECSRNRWDNLSHLTPEDEIKFVLADRPTTSGCDRRHSRPSARETRGPALASCVFGRFRRRTWSAGC